MTIRASRKKMIYRWVTITMVIAAATYGFASANTVNLASLSGQDYGVKSVFQVSGISYTLDTENPEYFSEVQFRLENQSQPVYAGVSAEKNSAVIWADSCTTEGFQYSCRFESSVHVLDADWLHVAEIK